MTEIANSPESVSRAYSLIGERIAAYSELVGRPLSLSEKILVGHMASPPGSDLDSAAGRYAYLRPDRVALQDVTGQMVILQFMTTGLGQTKIPTTIHCDHLIRAKVDEATDMKASLGENDEVFEFLRSAAAKYGCGFWKPGAGIIHQVVLENYAFPGGLMIGTDSHTPNAGGLGMIAIGVGGIDAAEAMAGLEWEVRYPRRIGVHLSGKMSGWTAPKDVILCVAGKLGVSGGTNSIIEYYGEGAESISCTGKATITNMGAEIGATCSIFPYDAKMSAYLRATGRKGIADIADANLQLLVPDEGAHYDRVIEIDLSELEPHVVGPHTPDLARPISEMAADVQKNGYPDTISTALIGSCTNSSYEDMTRAASVAKQASSRNFEARTPLLVTPGSEQIRATIERDGQMETLRGIGAVVLANACGPCIGQWSRPEVDQSRPNTIVTSYNRNFPGRNDGSRSTMNFIASPEIVVALSLGGRLSFNPLADELSSPDGTKFVLVPPPAAPDIPERGFAAGAESYIAPPDDAAGIAIQISPTSKRIQALAPFDAWDGSDFGGLHVMLKAKGKCTTDHISPAGAWLSFRGHIDNLSDNMLLGAVNAFGGHVGKGINSLGGKLEPFPDIGRAYSEAGHRWVIIGDENYGEGSSREHAAITPRYLGCAAVIVRSFARIHETNLKKQGVLALTFSDPADYEKILEGDTVDIVGLDSIRPSEPVRCVIHHADGKTDEIKLAHSYNEQQLAWFRAGSALNVLKTRT